MSTKGIALVALLIALVAVGVALNFQRGSTNADGVAETSN
jgi:hypothetical protein